MILQVVSLLVEMRVVALIVSHTLALLLLHSSQDITISLHLMDQPQQSQLQLQLKHQHIDTMELEVLMDMF